MKLIPFFFIIAILYLFFWPGVKAALGLQSWLWCIPWLALTGWFSWWLVGKAPHYRERKEHDAYWDEDF